jgi:hypothetical protein
MYPEQHDPQVVEPEQLGQLTGQLRVDADGGAVEHLPVQVDGGVPGRV